MQIGGEEVLIDISSNNTTSNAFDFSGFSKLAIQFPAAWTGTTPTVSFTASADQDGTFVAVHESNTPGAIDVSVTTSTISAVVGTDAEALAPCKWLKIVASAAQAADRSMIVFME